MGQTQNSRRPAQPALVFGPGHRRRAQASADQAGGLRHRGLQGQAGHRHSVDVVRLPDLPLAFSGAHRGHQARHLAGRRISRRDPGAERQRKLPASDQHALSQPAGDGGGGGDPRPSDRRRRPARRLRQDRPGTGDGRRVGQRAGDFRAGGRDAQRPLAPAHARHRLEHLGRRGGLSRRQDQRPRMDRDVGGDRPLARHLQHDGHRLDDDHC